MENPVSESFWHRNRLFFSIALILLISGTVFLTNAIRSMKAGSAKSVVYKLEQTLCVQLSLPFTEFQHAWRNYEGRKNLNNLSLPELDLHEVDAYIVQQCVVAEEIAQALKLAQTDKAKAKIYDTAIELYQVSDATSLQMTQGIYDEAITCVDALGDAMDADIDGTNALAAKAKMYASAGNWAYCSRFSTEAIADLKAQHKCDTAFAKATEIADSQNSFLVAATTYRHQSDWVSCEYFSDRAVEDTNAMHSCQESFANAQGMSLQLGMPLQIITDAEVSLASSDWSSCSFYSEQAIATLAPYMPTATPPP